MVISYASLRNDPNFKRSLVSPKMENDMNKKNGKSYDQKMEDHMIEKWKQRKPWCHVILNKVCLFNYLGYQNVHLNVTKMEKEMEKSYDQKKWKQRKPWVSKMFT